MDIWEYFKNLFNKAETSSTSQPFIHEVIKRTEEELVAYENWKDRLERRRLTDWLIAEYTSSKNNPGNVDPALDFMDNSRAQGFIIHYQEEHLASDYVFLLDYLKEKTLEMGYRSYMSDQKTYQKGAFVEGVQRHYLKPNPQADSSQPINQQFGNITIELVFRDEKTHHLRLMATGYSDRLYTETRDFKEFMFGLQ